MSTKHPIQTTTNTSSSTLPPLPPSQTFDILPALHELLSRIEQSPTTNDLFPLVQDQQTESEGIGSHYPSDTLIPLLPKDLPEEVVKSVKSRIRAAVRAVEKLPDVERGCEEQEEEIVELERRIREQGDVLRGLGGVVEGLRGGVIGGS